MYTLEINSLMAQHFSIYTYIDFIKKNQTKNSILKKSKTKI